MSVQTAKADALISVLLPELKKLCNNAPDFGKITLTATIHDSDIGNISLGIETTRKIASLSMRGGNR
jgi:hypothetical protein